MRPTALRSLVALALAAPLAAHGPPAPRADAFRALHGEAAATRIVAVEADVAELAAAGYDLAQHGSQNPGEPVDVVAGPRDLARLQEAGYTIRPVASVLSAHPGVLDDEWSSYEEVTARVDALVAANPDLLFKMSSGSSIEGRDIFTVRFSTTPQVRDVTRPKVSINGNHHAREVMTVEAALDVLTQLVSRYRAGDAKALRWAQELEVYVSPVVNPDGYAHVTSEDTWWRKNRRVNANGSKGVDLNRNYPYAWGANDDGSSGSPYSETYRGTGPASEPEAAAMVALARRIKPLFNLSYHSYGEVLLFPYGYENAQNPVGDVMPELATELSSRMTRDTGSGSYGKRSRLYPVNGLDRDWYYNELGTYSFVPEISARSRGFHPSYSWVEPTVTGLRGGWTYLLDRAVGESIRGRVVDLHSHQPLDAQVAVKEVQWRNGEVHRTDVDGGFSKLLGAGSYHLQVSAEGYESVERWVVVPAGKRAWFEIGLEPVSP